MGPDPSGSSTTASSASTSTPSGVTSPVITKLPREGSNITKIRDPLDETNWVVWRERIRRIFALCGVAPYVFGTIPRPDPGTADPETVAAWDNNDVYAQILITNAISKDQMVHVSRLNTAYDIWRSLEAIHETRDYQVAIAIQRGLFRQCATDDDDIVDHLTQLKKQWERLNVLDNEDFRITDIQFKTIIASSLPPSWDAFTEPYVGRRQGITETDPKKLTSSQEFIGIIKEEYGRRKTRKDSTTIAKPTTSSTYYSNTHSSNKRSLTERIQDPTTPANVSSGTFCRNCRQNTHTTDNCKWLGQPKCNKCGWFGHIGSKCFRNKQKRKNENEEGGKGKVKKTEKREQVHRATEDEHEHANEGITFTAEESAGICNFDTYDPHNVEEIDDRMIFYSDWLADTATSSHIVNTRNAFVTFNSLIKPISGVGNVITNAQGRGTVDIRTQINEKRFALTLENVLYVPHNPHNLLSLGRWDNAGGEYRGGNGQLALITKDGRTIATGRKTKNNLYKMKNFVVQTSGSTNSETSIKNKTYKVGESAKSWEIWHKRYGHIGMGSLQELLDKQLVNGFTVDTQSPKYDCEACTQAKQHITSFPKITERNRELTRPGELTHTDVWGPYSVRSIHGNLYFITFLDDGTRRPRLHFLKAKDEGGQAVKDYIMYLKVQGLLARFLRCDQGTEYLNDGLKTWLREQGIELQTTAPYSPSQNGAAERLNRTLIELTRAMLVANDIPTFLWEYAVMHAAYLRERAPTRPLQGKTPYEAWFHKKPDVSHLREFGIPVYILLQGQKEPPKLMPRSKRYLFVGYKDGSHSVRYYNPETRRVLTSRNFHFLDTLPTTPSAPELILVDPAVLREGESVRCGDNVTQQPGTTHPANVEPGSVQPGYKRMREEPEEMDDESKRRKLRTLAPVNYRFLNDPFPDEEGDEIHLTSEQITYQVYCDTPLGGEDPKTLPEAKGSPDWLEWEKAIKVELDQLDHMGTWQLVDCPVDAVPLANKWVFVRKYNKMGELLKYKARLVVKGCAQRPGFDYTDTFSPVVRLETIRAILSLAPSKKLQIQQMDVKGAYLNGILKENVYMRQPDGFDDGTKQVCWLRKTLYGLKQSGREWNKELDRRLKEKGFRNLLSDPCAYIRRDQEDLEIITVWVDDLLLFATAIWIMSRLKHELNDTFELTDLGEPTKIVGIEIDQRAESLIISQKQYIDSILQKYGMGDANPVSTPMDPNISLEPNNEKGEMNRSNAYASLIGSLQYLATATRPDIAYAVNRLAAYTANPSFTHYGIAKRVLRYIKGTRNYGITYRAHSTRHVGPTDSNIFYGFSDAAYANADDRRSISGYVYLSNGGAITWGSKKQTTIALSSTEAEYVALSEASREAMWLRHLYGELGYIQKEPILLLGDNDGSIAMARNPEFHKRTKHVDIRWHWVRELVSDGLMNIVDCRDPEQTADVLTKQLPRPKFARHVNELGLSSV